MLWAVAALCVGLALLAPALGASGEAPIATTETALPPARPGSAVAATVQSLVDSGKYAGALALVASRDRVLEVAVAGYAEIGAHQPIRPDSMFWIASMSKAMTAATVMMLADEGRLSVDDPVEKYLPEFKDVWVRESAENGHEVLRRPAHPITVRNLLTHTSGLVPRSPLETPWIDLLPLAENVKVYPLVPLAFEPGTRYQYSNAGINTAGRIVEVISGMPFETFLQTRLLEPLGMKDTTFWPTAEQVARLAKSYRKRANGAWEEVPIDQVSYPLTDRRRGPCPAGGLFSTAEDVSRFCRMLLAGGRWEGKRLLTEKAVQEMSSVQTGELSLDPPDDAGYGYGLVVPRRLPNRPAPENLGTFGHSGAYATAMSVDPVHGFVTVLMVQRASPSRPENTEARAELQQSAIADCAH